MPRLGRCVALAARLCLAPRVAAAFCGFYVGGADARLFNNATLVVLMRDGTRTVLSMQNNYQGPPEDFAMVVPVPVVLQKDNVKTLDRRLFERVDRLAAPRLVEYWEQDPCMHANSSDDEAGGVGIRHRGEEGRMGAPTRKAVTVEATFQVGEYDVVILSAEEAGALDAWIREHGYKIPEGAAEALRPYVQAGMKFFVAKVNIGQVHVRPNGTATLSPLRFHYDSESFSLPVRLGLLNSGGVQDLVVHVLARSQRYEVANYPNAYVPTNIDVRDGVRESFGSFYAALFDATLARNPGAVVTEYAWGANSCDPCPAHALKSEELLALGLDVAPSYQSTQNLDQVRALEFDMVLTRLHARYPKDGLGEDLIFRAAPPIVGGREDTPPGAHPAEDEVHHFQARYAIRHPWTGRIRCDVPPRGIWGGPPDDETPRFRSARSLSDDERAFDLAAHIAVNVPEIGLMARSPGCSCAASDPRELPPALLLLLAALPRRRRPRA